MEINKVTDEGVQRALNKVEVRRIARELAPKLDSLIDELFVGSDAGRNERNEKLHQFLWDNKVGILRVLQEVAKL